MNELGLLSLHLLATLLMVGIIWFVQIVHYPLMVYVGREEFCRYSEKNQSRTSWIVAGPMLLEALTGAVLSSCFPGRIGSPIFLGSLVLLIAIWLSTAALQMPIHRALLDGFDERLIRRLVRSNWMRTVAWSLRGVLVGVVWCSAVSSSF